MLSFELLSDVTHCFNVLKYESEVTYRAIKGASYLTEFVFINKVNQNYCLLLKKKPSK